MEKAYAAVIGLMATVLLMLIAYIGDKGVTAVETNTTAVTKMGVVVNRMEDDRKEHLIVERKYQATVMSDMGLIEKNISRVEARQRELCNVSKVYNGWTKHQVSCD